MDRLSAEPGCGGEEVSLLRELGRELGTCPAESQLALLKLYSARFDKLISAAEKSARWRRSCMIREECTVPAEFLRGLARR